MDVTVRSSPVDIIQYSTVLQIRQCRLAQKRASRYIGLPGGRCFGRIRPSLHLFRLGYLKYFSLCERPAVKF